MEPYRGKRLLDLVVGSVLGVVTLPLLAAAASTSAIALRAWPFFTHRRIGRNGQEFTILKIRTLAPGSDRYALKTSPQWNAPQKPVLRWLRSTHLDELPQLLHVLTGQLSLVGPRPKMPDEVERVDPAYGKARVRVPQGCTGLWQVGPENGQLPCRHPEYDLWYVENQSLRLDLWILWRTVVMLLGAPCIDHPQFADDVRAPASAAAAAQDGLAEAARTSIDLA